MAQGNDTQGGAGGYWGYNGTGQKVWISQKANVTAPTATPVTQRQKEQEYQQSLMQKQGYSPQMAVALPQLPSMAKAMFGPTHLATTTGDRGEFPLWAINNNKRGLGGRKNLFDEDVPNTDTIFGINGIRPPLDTRFPGGVNYEDATNYLPDNYPWLYPEASPNDIPLWGGSGGDGGSGAGGGEDNPYIPTWGGGGYSMRDYYRDNGLINWRI